MVFVIAMLGLIRCRKYKWKYKHKDKQKQKDKGKKERLNNELCLNDIMYIEYTVSVL